MPWLGYSYTPLTPTRLSCRVESRRMLRIYTVELAANWKLADNCLRVTGVSTHRPAKLYHRGVKYVTFTVHTCVLQQYLNIALPVHNTCKIWQKRVVTRYTEYIQWNKCDIIFQLLRASPQTPPELRPWTLRGISVLQTPWLSSVDTPTIKS